MKPCLCLIAIVAVILLVDFSSTRGQDLELPLEQITTSKQTELMDQYWRRQADQAFRRWRADYEARKTAEQIAAYQKGLHEKFLAAIGGLPQRTPLNPQVTGKVQRDGYLVEKILFESQPKHFVTALFFLPDAARFTPPYPGVLVPCGHVMSAKGHHEYQSMGALLALNGMAALVFDPIDQGERVQYLRAWPPLWSVGGHEMIGIGSVLLGRNAARFEIWDGMRALDYLESRPEVDPKRIGCTGNSGGGTQTSYLMALDGRIRAAAPSCYLCGFPGLFASATQEDAEQDIFGQLAFGMDHADYIMMLAPRPVLLLTATKDFFDIKGSWAIFRDAKRLYTRMEFAERVDLLENDAGHNYNNTQREGAARWMSRWLLGKDQVITEPPLRLLAEAEYRCSPSGNVMQLPGARSTYDLNEDDEKQLAPRRAQAWKNGDRAELLAQVRRLAGIRALADLPKLEARLLSSTKEPDMRVEKLLFVPEEGLYLPAMRFVPSHAKPCGTVLYLHADGKSAEAASGGAIQRLLKEGKEVLALDLPGVGQTKPASEKRAVTMAYLLGRSYVGLRAESILEVARWMKEQSSAKTEIDLIVVGHVGTAALHAAALEPELFSSVKISHSLGSWSSVVHAWRTDVQKAELVHGALRVYDLSDLAASLGPKVVIESPTDGKAAPYQPVNTKTRKKP